MKKAQKKTLEKEIIKIIGIVLEGLGSQYGVYITMDGGELRIDDIHTTYTKKRK